MSTVAVLGAGNGGLATAAELTLGGHSVRLYNRSPRVLDAIAAGGGIHLDGVLGTHTISPSDTTCDIAQAVAGADAVIVVLPATAHPAVAADLAGSLAPGTPVILNPGHMCGSLHFGRIFTTLGVEPPPLAEFGTLTYVCRSPSAGAVDVYLRAVDLPLAVVAPDDATIEDTVRELFGNFRRAAPVEVWLHDVNMVLHPPGMILGAAWIEATEGDFHFYGNGVTAAVAAVMGALDEERRRVGAAFGVELPDLARTMAGFGTADPASAARGDLRAAVAGGRANRAIRAPSSLDHRYLTEDVPYGLVPFTVLARAAGVTTPTADALITLATVIAGRDMREEGLNAHRLGILGVDAEELKAVASG